VGDVLSAISSADALRRHGQWVGERLRWGDAMPLLAMHVRRVIDRFGGVAQLDVPSPAVDAEPSVASSVTLDAADAGDQGAEAGPTNLAATSTAADTADPAATAGEPPMATLEDDETAADEPTVGATAAMRPMLKLAARAFGRLGDASWEVSQRLYDLAQ
jgi:hypothetical protein